MDNLFTNVGAKLKAFAKIYFKITMWLLIISGVISFFALLAMGEEMAPFAFGVLLYVPLMILSTLVSCWVLHAFGSIAEKHEDGEPMVESAAQPQEVVVGAKQTGQAAPVSVESTEAAEAKQEGKEVVVILVSVISILALIAIVLAGIQ